MPEPSDRLAHDHHHGVQTDYSNTFLNTLLEAELHDVRAAGGI